MKKTLIIITISVIIAGCIYLVKHRNFFVSNVSQTQGVTIAPLFTEKSSAKYETMDMTYPKSSSTEYPEIFNFIQKSKNDWLTENGNISDKDAEMMHLGADRIYSYVMTTKIATSSKTVTYEIEVYEFTGGAHGNTDITTFTYDKQKKLVTLSDVFAKPYLEKVAKLSRTFFYNTLGDYAVHEMIDSGTEPAEDNFSTWYLTDDSVVFIFGQYQVGPYVIGIQEYPIPKSLISDILSPSFK